MIGNMRHGGSDRSARHSQPGDRDRLEQGDLQHRSLIKGVYGREMFETWYKMTVFIESGLDLTPIITHRFRYDEFALGFEAMRSGASGKVILDWTCA
jgi:threonine 3-dehydrogenase